MRSRPKISDLLLRVRRCIELGQYLDTRHASDRRAERSITRPEILYVLRSGWHEKSKDRFQPRFRNWNYSVRGKTIDGRELRVVVSFETSGLLIITAIELGKHGD